MNTATIATTPPALDFQPLRFARRALGFVRQFTPRAASTPAVVVVPAPETADINCLAHTPDHMSLRCELHDEDRLLTSVPIIAGRAGERDAAFLDVKARLFPHSWNAVRAADDLPASSLIGEPPRFLVRCCPRCRAVARHFIECKPQS